MSSPSERRPNRPAPFLLVAIVLSAFPGACSGPAVHDGEDPEPFAGALPTLEALGEAALTALVRGDTATLASLRLSQREHDDVVYPELPAAASFPVDLAWENVERRGRRDLARQLARFRERDVRYAGTFCPGEPQTWDTFRVLTDCGIVFDDPEHGRSRVRLFEDVVVRAGGHKLVRYYDHPPRPVGSP